MTFNVAAVIREWGYRAVSAPELDGDRLAAAAGLGRVDQRGRLVVPRLGTKGVRGRRDSNRSAARCRRGGSSHQERLTAWPHTSSASRASARRTDPAWTFVPPPASTPHPTRRSIYIDPDICIACEQCEIVCPVNAIYLDADVPPQWQDYIEVNAAFFRENKAAPTSVSLDQARAIVAAVQALCCTPRVAGEHRGGRPHG